MMTMVTETDAVVKEIILRTPDVKSFRVVPNADIDFKAGQWLMVKIKTDKELSKPLSISSSPTEQGYLEFTKKLTGSDFSQALARLKPGDQVNLKYPFGKFTYEDHYPKIAFISGGIGVTPIRSIAKWIADKRLETDVILIDGNNTVGDIVFRDDFETMRRQSRNFKIVHVILKNDGTWTGETGLINERVIKQEVPDYLSRRFYLCGPPAMVDCLKKVLLDELGISRDNLVTENFSGYS